MKTHMCSDCRSPRGACRSWCPALQRAVATRSDQCRKVSDQRGERLVPEEGCQFLNGCTKYHVKGVEVSREEFEDADAAAARSRDPQSVGDRGLHAWQADGVDRLRSDAELLSARHLIAYALVAVQDGAVTLVRPRGVYSATRRGVGRYQVALDVPGADPRTAVVLVTAASGFVATVEHVRDTVVEVRAYDQAGALADADFELHVHGEAVQSVGLRHEAGHADYSQDLIGSYPSPMISDPCHPSVQRALRQEFLAKRAALDPALASKHWALTPDHAPHPADPSVVRVALGFGSAHATSPVPACASATFTVTAGAGLRLRSLLLAGDVDALLVKDVTVGRYSLISDAAGLPAALFSAGQCERCEDSRLRDLVGRWPDIDGGSTLSVTVVNTSDQPRAVRGAFVAETLTSLVEAERARQAKAAADAARGPECDGCGHVAVKNGATWKCLNCGNTMAADFGAARGPSVVAISAALRRF